MSKKKKNEWSSSDVKGASFGVMSRKIMVLDAPTMRCVVSEIAVEQQHDEQAC